MKCRISYELDAISSYFKFFESHTRNQNYIKKIVSFFSSLKEIKIDEEFENFTQFILFFQNIFKKSGLSSVFGVRVPYLIIVNIINFQIYHTQSAFDCFNGGKSFYL